MKKQFIVTALMLGVLAGILLTVYIVTSGPIADRPIRLVITGPEGQRFTGSYVANGITNTVNAVTPVTIACQAKELRYEFQPGDHREEFRINLEVADVRRTSFVSYQGKSVKGGYSYALDHESVW